MHEGLLEPDALKGARPVLRGAGDSDASPPTRLRGQPNKSNRPPTTQTSVGAPAAAPGLAAHRTRPLRPAWIVPAPLARTACR
jgi:hypothetical protein